MANEIFASLERHEGRCAVHTGLQVLHDVAERVTGLDRGAGDFLFGLFLEELEKMTDAIGIDGGTVGCPDCDFEAGRTPPSVSAKEG